MFGLLGLFGLFMAGYLASPVTEDPDDQGDPRQGGDADAGRAGSQAEPSDEGMPFSDDIEDEIDPPLFMGGTVGSDILNGGSGDDWLSGGEARDALAGSDGDDTLLGGVGEDDLNGGAGDDSLVGGGGADQVMGDAGDDTIYGWPGDDRLHGGAGADSIAGGLGHDTVLGGEGADALLGGGGDDWLAGGEGDDRMAGDAGNDTLDGGAGDDRMDGGAGRDYLNAGDGNDVLRLSGETHATGGAGADLFEVAVGGTSVIADYDGREDRLVVVYDPMEGQEEPEVSLQVDGADALILLDGQVLARVADGAGLTLADVQVRPV